MKGPTLLWELALHSGMPSHRNVSKSRFDPVSSSCSHSQILSAVSQGHRRRDTTPTFSMDSLPTNQSQPPTSHGCFQDSFTLEWAPGGHQSPFSLFREFKGETQQGLQLHSSSAPGFCHFLLGPPAVRDHQPPRRLFPSSQDPRTVIEGKAHQPGSVDKEEALEGICPELGCKVSGWRRHRGVARTCILGRQARDGGVGRTGNRF